jgi:hypothetical protein
MTLHTLHGDTMSYEKHVESEGYVEFFGNPIVNLLVYERHIHTRWLI